MRGFDITWKRTSVSSILSCRFSRIYQLRTQMQLNKRLYAIYRRITGGRGLFKFITLLYIPHSNLLTIPYPTYLSPSMPDFMARLFYLNLHRPYRRRLQNIILISLLNNSHYLKEPLSKRPTSTLLIPWLPGGALVKEPPFVVIYTLVRSITLLPKTALDALIMSLTVSSNVPATTSCAPIRVSTRMSAFEGLAT